VIGGGIAAAGDLLFDSVRGEIRQRVLMTAQDAVTLVTAELGTWAGSIGAAVHGAEQAEAGESIMPGTVATWSSAAVAGPTAPGLEAGQG
jgi:glucokinase